MRKMSNRRYPVDKSPQLHLHLGACDGPGKSTIHVGTTWAASKTWLQRCSNPKVLSPPLSPRFRAQGFHFRDPLLLSPAFAATFAVFRRKVVLLIMVVTKTYTCSLSRRLSRLFILKALSRSFRQAFARGVLAYAQHKNINVYLKPYIHKGFWCCSHVNMP